MMTATVRTGGVPGTGLWLGLIGIDRSRIIQIAFEIRSRQSSKRVEIFRIVVFYTDAHPVFRTKLSNLR